MLPSSQDAPNCTRWHTPTLLDCTLPSMLSRRSQAHSQARFEVHSQSHLTICLHICCWVLDPVTWWVAGARPREEGDGWHMVAEIMTPVNIIVQISSSPCPLRRDLTMIHGQGVDNCSLRFGRKGSQLDLGVSRSPTQISRRNLLPAYH